MDLLAKIHASRKSIIADIREYARSQKEDWQRIPWLALQADGRNGYSEHYQYACCHGLWLVYGIGKTPAIDCATGELVDWKLEPLCDWEVFALGNKFDMLNATKIIRDLQKQASNKIRSWDTQDKFDERARWRDGIIKRLSLSRTYVRHPEVAAAA